MNIIKTLQILIRTWYMKKTFFYKLSILIILNCILVTNYAYSQSPPPPVSLEEYEIDTAQPV